MFTIAPGENTERALAVRNPYYWKVDTEGNQLPYLERIVYQMVSDPQVLLLKTMQGEIDMMDQYIATPTNKSVLFDAKDKGGFEFYTLTSTDANAMCFIFNLNHNDETKRKLFQKSRLPRGPVARHRPAIADRRRAGRAGRACAALDQEGRSALQRDSSRRSTPSSIRPRPTRCSTSSSRSATASNFRLDEKGRRLTIIFELDQSRTAFLDMFQLVIPMFQAVGIDAQMRSMDRSLWETRVRQGRDFDATAHIFGANGGIAAMLDARYYVPNSANAIYAPGWQLWYRDRANPRAVEPDELTKKQLALFDKLSRNGQQRG